MLLSVVTVIVDESLKTVGLQSAGTRVAPYIISSFADYKNFTDCIVLGQIFSGQHFKQTAMFTDMLL